MSGEDERFTPYQWRLFLFLSVATFFEGYDFIALSQILPNLREDMNLSTSTAGAMIAIINIGTVAAYALVRIGDRIGRKRLLTITIAGYTVFTFLTGLANNAVSFTIFQFVARVFLIAEWAISMVYAAEEFPAARRGLVIGVISAFASMGSVVCAGVVPLLLQAPWGWRTVYFSAAIPLVLVAVARRNIRETQRFAEQVGERGERRPFHYIMTTPYRRWVIRLAVIWGLTYIGTATAVTYWKEFAVGERGLSDSQVGLAISIAAVLSMPLVFYAGRLLDVAGRKRGAAIIYFGGVAGLVGSYTLHGQWPLTVALVFGLFGVAAVLPVLNAFTTELFPTELRADAFAWSNNLLGRIGYVITPAIVGVVAHDWGYGIAVTATAVFPMIALFLLLRFLPETRGMELEELAALAHEPPPARVAKTSS